MGFGTHAEQKDPIESVLVDLLQYEEILGAVAISCEGLVVGCAGFSRQDAEMVGALGAALVGAADRSTRRLGAGTVREFSLSTNDGMIHVGNGGEFAVMLFTEQCDPVAAGELCRAAVEAIGQVIA